MEAVGALNAAELKIVETFKNDHQMIASVRRLAACKIIQLARSVVQSALAQLPVASSQRKRLEFLLLSSQEENSKYFHSL